MREEGSIRMVWRRGKRTDTRRLEGGGGRYFAKNSERAKGRTMGGEHSGSGEERGLRGD